MDLPINDKELATIVSALRLGGDAALYQKLNTIKNIREENPSGPYKKIAREEFGFVIWYLHLYKLNSEVMLSLIISFQKKYAINLEMLP